MELKLNIYKNGEVEKTYKVNDFHLTTGVCQDIIEQIDIDKLLDGGLDNRALAVECIKIVTKSFSKFRPFLQDIFCDLTDEEYRRTSISEVANIIIGVVKFTVNQLYNIGGSSKN